MTRAGNRIDEVLAQARASGRTVLAPYVTVGFPDVRTSLDIAAALVDSGADLLELGIPFSDPIAEGLTIQKTTFKALQQGVSVATCLDAVSNLRARGVATPLIFMGYYNPFLRYGLAQFVQDASRSGLDGLIVADLPAEESGYLRELCDEREIRLVPMLAPTSTDRRIAGACKPNSGFIYCVSLTGVTGARAEFRAEVEEQVASIRRHTELPVLVGFGVSRREHVAEIGRFAEGAAVGSALLQAIADAPQDQAVQAAVDFITALKPSHER